jgi:Tol biopolymer transport system component
MKKKYTFLIMTMIIGTIFISCNQRTDSKNKYEPELTNLRGPYLGQTPPGLIPEIFAPGILSTEANEFNAAFTPSGDAVYFTMTSKTTQNIFVIKMKKGYWQERKQASFSGTYRDVDPFISHDGEKLFFSSNRPNNEVNKQDDCDFWYVERQASGRWGEAKHLNNPCTQGKNDFYYVSNLYGEIYYSIFDEDGNGNLYFISPKPADQTPNKLDTLINTEYNEHDPYIAPDGSYLIFTSNRPGGYGSADLYICFKQASDTWSDPINMGKTINSDKYDYCAILSPDEKYLFFSSSRSGNGDVYWVDAKIIEELRTEHLK